MLSVQTSCAGGVKGGKAPLVGSAEGQSPPALKWEVLRGIQKRLGVPAGQRGVDSVEFFSGQVRALFFRAACP